MSTHTTHTHTHTYTHTHHHTVPEYGDHKWQLCDAEDLEAMIVDRTLQWDLEVRDVRLEVLTRRLRGCGGMGWGGVGQGCAK